VYLNLFRSEWDSWIEKLVKLIPVQLLVVGEEMKEATGDKRWSDFFDQVQNQVNKNFKGRFSFWTRGQFLVYNRECDWYRLFWEFPELKKNIPIDFKEKNCVHLTLECSLLRVLIQLYGENDRKRYSANIYARFCGWASKGMKDGELLHIAVEVGSFQGVKSCAWPGFINWTNEDNKTALELSLEKWGPNHKITKFLQAEIDKLVASGFLTERNIVL